ncbi:hypothetical protein L1049_011001 [Liquidambar formosana]|uniref:Protein kinase domain-containing protein n=1 Tax=Liquidambar formosana TaxID=63359 RepID=A0AAP0RR23_LIQFO
MAKKICHLSHLLLFMVFLSIHYSSSQLQSSQSQTLLRIQQLLNYPSALNNWSGTTDFCNTEPNPSFTIVCYEDSITQLHIIGNNGDPPLPPNFFTDSFFATLVSLPSLKVLSLVSLGLWGPLPSRIGHLPSLEILNITSNYFNGTIPTEVSSLRNLQTLILDHNLFTGQVPDWFSSLPVLSVLSLKNNSLSGSLPNSLTSMENLRILSLSMNHLTGEVPDLRNLTNLQVLDLEDNYFGPHFPSLHTKLVTLVLRKNWFYFGIPAELCSYYQLQKLDISLNGFEGPFLPSLLTLPSITHLNIAENRFTGILFQNMSCNAELVFVDLSSNLLTGDLPTCLQSESNSRVILYTKNCMSNGDQEQLPFSSCHNEALAVEILPPKQRKRREFAKAALASSILGGVAAGIALVSLASLVMKRVSTETKNTKKMPPTRIISENVSTLYTAKLLSVARYICQTMKLGALGLPAYRTFALEELKDATNNFDCSSFMGEGSHGQIYKGRLTDGTLVGIRSLKMRKRHGIQTYTRHIEMISKLRHCHLVSALGHCFECHPDDSSVSRIFLIFEFVPNGTLRGYISGQKLTWTQKIAAALGVAKGIQFLHTGIVPGVFSNDLKITDVVMDQNHYAKISNYNLPLLAENKKMVSGRVSSIVPKEGVQARVKHEDKDDIYDLGIILLEIILGRPIMSEDEVVVKDLLLVNIKADDTARNSIVDPTVNDECSEESWNTLMELCIRCLSSEPIDRPSIEDVIWNLQFAAQVQVSWRGESQSNQESLVSPS